MFMIVVVVVLMLEEVLLVLLVSKLHVVQPSPRVWGVLTMGDLATSLPPSTKRPSLVECTMESTTKVQEEELEIIEQEKKLRLSSSSCLSSTSSSSSPSTCTGMCWDDGVTRRRLWI